MGQKTFIYIYFFLYNIFYSKHSTCLNFDLILSKNLRWYIIYIFFFLTRRSFRLFRGMTINLWKKLYYYSSFPFANYFFRKKKKRKKNTLVRYTHNNILFLIWLPPLHPFFYTKRFFLLFSDMIFARVTVRSAALYTFDYPTRAIRSVRHS